MRAIFCYDGPIKYDEDGLRYGVALNNTVFDRYLNYVDFLKLAVRIKRCDIDFDSKKNEKIDMSNMEIIPLPNLSTLKGICFDRKKVKRILSEEFAKIDFAIIRVPSMIGYEAIKIAEKLKIPYLVEVVGCPWDALWNHSIKGKMIAPYSTLTMKRLVKKSHYVVYVTNEFLQKRYPTNGVSISCSDVEIKNISEEILSLRLKHIENNKGKIILGTTAAVNVPYKGHQYVIEALARLKKQGINNFEYQMVGDGDQSRLKKIIKDLDVEKEVIFMGAKTHEQVFEWLDTIDIYIQPSRQEGLPRALIEAMSRALPCIGAKTGGIPELLPSERVFSNGRNNINEICTLLLSLDKEKMKEDAYRNYNESKKYVIENTKRKRNEIFNLIIENIK
jgi:glycosyltransferase involved in cell wall biosynthesis